MTGSCQMEDELGQWECNQMIVTSGEEQSDCEKMREVHVYIDMVKKIVEPGCSPEVLKIALTRVTDLVDRLSSISTQRERRCSL